MRSTPAFSALTAAPPNPSRDLTTAPIPKSSVISKPSLSKRGLITLLITASEKDAGVALSIASTRTWPIVVAVPISQPQIDDWTEVHRDAEAIELTSLDFGVLAHGFFARVVGLEVGDRHSQGGLPFQGR